MNLEHFNKSNWFTQEGVTEASKGIKERQENSTPDIEMSSN